MNCVKNSGVFLSLDLTEHLREHYVIVNIIDTEVLKPVADLGGAKGAMPPLALINNFCTT